MRLAVHALPLVLPLAVRWAESQETDILARGIPLPEQNFFDAIGMGVHHPQRIRLLKVDEIPIPGSSLLRVAAKLTGMLTSATVGMSLRYGIFIRADFWENRHLIAHECVHTAQYERFGGIRPFLGQYLRECLADGYPQSALEQEAVSKSAGIPG